MSTLPPSRPQKPVVQAADKIAIQNQIIMQTMDEIIDRAMKCQDELDELQATQLKKTINVSLTGDLLFGGSFKPDLPKPKALNRNSSSIPQSNQAHSSTGPIL
ncbi:MAG TPA: hypothetical protein PKD64_02785 [Pirellulaceae bacterium]|nr:hypothetical protein [Pirellulaceae bacterium]HMO91095.1 hypothetical protein [Pirellulaceae bacterium]HMP70557.1 hypothetical protein [Pirellulaceae bacterium]